MLFPLLKIIKYRLDKGWESVSCDGELLSGWTSRLTAFLVLSVSVYMWYMK